MKRIALSLVLACATPAPQPAPPPKGPEAPASLPDVPVTNIDVRIRFEEGADPDFGDNATSVRAWLDVPALGLQRKLFSVPFPYQCARREPDGSAAGGTSQMLTVDASAAGGTSQMLTVNGSAAGGTSQMLTVDCTGQDGTASASVRVDAASVIVVASDYGAIGLHRTHDEFPLPRGATATLFAPRRYPGASAR